MTLDQRLAQAVRHVADGVVVPAVDPDAVRARARRNRRQAGALVAAAAVVAVVAAGATVLTGRDDASSPMPASPVSPSVAESPSSSAQLPTGPRSWEAYVSTQYGFTIGHPPDWTELPATPGWIWEFDGQDYSNQSHDAFLSPDGRVRVSAWNAPIEPGTREESMSYLVGWVEDYCEETGNSPCTGIADRAVELCVEKWACHPGLLVPFKDDVQAFFSGGLYPEDAMTVVAVWRPESSRFVESYGGSQRLLEDVLSTMQVWPSSTPRSQRK